MIGAGHRHGAGSRQRCVRRGISARAIGAARIGAVRSARRNRIGDAAAAGSAADDRATGAADMRLIDASQAAGAGIGAVGRTIRRAIGNRGRRTETSAAVADAGGRVARCTGAAGEDIIGWAADDGAHGAAHALDHALRAGARLDDLGFRFVMHHGTRRVHHLHRASTQQGAATGTGAQFREGRSHRHAQLLSSIRGGPPSPAASSSSYGKEQNKSLTATPVNREIGCNCTKSGRFV